MNVCVSGTLIRIVDVGNHVQTRVDGEQESLEWSRGITTATGIIAGINNIAVTITTVIQYRFWFCFI